MTILFLVFSITIPLFLVSAILIIYKHIFPTEDTITSQYYQLNILKGETVALCTVRLAIGESQFGKLQQPVYGYNLISKKNFKILGKIVKNADSQNEWFSNINTKYMALVQNTSNKQITQISNGNYVATFIVGEENSNKVLLQYKFEVGNISGGAPIFVTNKKCYYKTLTSD